MTSYAHVLQYVTSNAWAILPERLQAIAAIVQLHVAGVRLSDAEVQARLQAAQQGQGARGGKRTGVTAVVPIYGVMIPRANLMAEMSGATSIESIRAAFRQAMADDDVSRVVFDIDSPGGSVDQVPEFAEEVRAARGQKPMTAVANTMMASAAYWVGSQADEVVASPSSLVGSIGVYAVHEDLSGAYEQAGVTPTLIKAGKYKAEGIDIAPLDDEAQGHMQELVNDAYDQFLSAVAKGRGTTVSAVRDGYGEGRVLTAKRAKDAGLVDRVDTIEGAYARTPRMQAAADDPRLAAQAEAEAQAAYERQAFATHVQAEADRQRAYAYERERRQRQVGR